MLDGTPALVIMDSALIVVSTVGLSRFKHFLPL
jgi:hypothetical protein